MANKVSLHNFETTSKITFYDFLDSIFYSYAQIFFSNRKWFGVVALLSTMIEPQVGALGILGVVLSNLLAIYLKFDNKKIINGYYGFNGILFGLSSGFFFYLTPQLFVVVIVFILLSFFLSATLEHLLANVLNLPGLSLPFITTLFVFLIFTSSLDLALYKPFIFDSNILGISLPKFVVTYFKAFSLILLQSNIITGIILATALLVFSRVMFVNSILAFAINYWILNLLVANAPDTLLVLTSFNAILTAFALGGNLVIVSKKSFSLILITTLFILIFTIFFEKMLAADMLPVLVLPFNFVVLSTIYSLKFRQEHTDITLLYFNPGSPEENYYYHKNRSSRFDRFKFLFPELPFWGEWKVTQGFNGEHTHKDDWQYAWDFVITDDEDKEYSDSGDFLEDYFCFDTPVVAPMDGEVVNILDNIPDNKIGEINLEYNFGNSIVIDHGEGLFSSLSHLKNKSVEVAVGERVTKGDILAKCGNSGRSPYPHLHFQFQLTNKIGDKTYKYPIAYFLENNEEKINLKSFSYPKENSSVRNIEAHKTLKKALSLQLWDKFSFECTLNDKSFIETWEIKADIFNNLYIENNNGARLFLFTQDKTFYTTDYLGKKDQALYFFYLSAPSIPLGFNENLIWEDEYPVSQTVSGPIRYLSEFFLLLGNQIESKANLSFKDFKNETTLLDVFENEIKKDKLLFIITNKIINKGSKLFRYYSDKIECRLLINQKSEIDKFEVVSKKNKFVAKLKREKNGEHN
jgi:urea transporter